MWLPFLAVAAIVVLWLWKPWEARQPQAASASATPTSTLAPSATFEVVPTATPLNSPTPARTATLPPNQTMHTVASGETIISIAKLYGTTKEAILKANKLKEISPIHAGQQLIVPLPPADTPTPTPTLQPSPTPFVYTIKRGDTLSEIARKYGTTVEALMRENGITDATSLREGQKLNIVKPPDLSATMAYDTYEVKQGDTLSTVAARYGVSVAQIKTVNGLKSDKLAVGQKLRIPVGTATPVPTLTPTPTATPTQAPPYRAPALLGPAEGAQFEGSNAAILLSWASVGILGKDEWYVVRLRRAGVVTEQLPLVWTKVTSWPLPPDLYASDLAEPQEFNWQVAVMLHTGASDDGAWTGQEISPRTGVRTVFWR